MSKRDGCKTACCWVPMDGVCAQQRKCPCHPKEPKPRTFADLLAEAKAHDEREHARARSVLDRRKS